MLGYAEVKKALGGTRCKRQFTQGEQHDIPTLSVEHDVEKSGRSFKVSGTLSQEGTDQPHWMDVTVRAVAGGETFDHSVAMNKREQRFKFSCPFEPDDLVVQDSLF